MKFQLSVLEGQTPARFKHDGFRFGDTEASTLKLHHAKAYRIVLVTSAEQIHIRPGEDGFNAKLRVTTIPASEKVAAPPDEEFDLQFEEESKDASRSRLVALWSCPFTKDKAVRRLEFWIQTTVQDFGVVRLPLLVKAYRNISKCAMNGFPLKYVQYEFRQDSSEEAKMVSVLYCRY